jgi:hypothetical protein
MNRGAGCRAGSCRGHQYGISRGAAGVVLSGFAASWTAEEVPSSLAGSQINCAMAERQSPSSCRNYLGEGEVNLSDWVKDLHFSPISRGVDMRATDALLPHLHPTPNHQQYTWFLGGPLLYLALSLDSSASMSHALGRSVADGSSRRWMTSAPEYHANRAQAAVMLFVSSYK